MEGVCNAVHDTNSFAEASSGRAEIQDTRGAANRKCDIQYFFMDNSGDLTDSFQRRAFLRRIQSHKSLLRLEIYVTFWNLHKVFPTSSSSQIKVRHAREGVGVREKCEE